MTSTSSSESSQLSELSFLAQSSTTTILTCSGLQSPSHAGFAVVVGAGVAGAAVLPEGHGFAVVGAAFGYNEFKKVRKAM